MGCSKILLLDCCAFRKPEGGTDWEIRAGFMENLQLDHFGGISRDIFISFINNSFIFIQNHLMIGCIIYSMHFVDIPKYKRASMI